ncbi:PD40 domain-containing protein, partial [bacterium]|nr:PD40 domain-containing protein [bacterium]
SEGFDGFPMWAPDGKTFVFGSNRHNSNEGDTNIFVTEWKD